VASKPASYTVRWYGAYLTGYENITSLIPPSQTVSAGGTATTSAVWTATVTGTVTIQLYYDGAWHTVGTVYQTAGNQVTFQVGVSNVQKDMDITVGVKKP
jgi:hypothetical protein